VPERVVVASGLGLSRAEAALRRAPGVRAVAPFGAALHVRVDPAALDAAAVAAVLSRAGAADVHAEEAAPSLEDVFLAVVGAGGEERA
jgi:ABC-2 type transport system ATP-binding protein